MTTVTHYGEGGYDPGKPNDNIIAVEEIEVTAEQKNAETLGNRIDDGLDKLRDGIASFDTLTAAQRWTLVKLALRVVLALARLQRGRTEVDG